MNYSIQLYPNGTTPCTCNCTMMRKNMHAQDINPQAGHSRVTVEDLEQAPIVGWSVPCNIWEVGLHVYVYSHRHYQLSVYVLSTHTIVSTEPCYDCMISNILYPRKGGAIILFTTMSCLFTWQLIGCSAFMQRNPFLCKNAVNLIEILYTTRISLLQSLLLKSCYC